MDEILNLITCVDILNIFLMPRSLWIYSVKEFNNVKTQWHHNNECHEKATKILFVFCSKNKNIGS